MNDDTEKVSDPLGLANRIIVLQESDPNAKILPRVFLPREDFFDQRDASLVFY